jgi:hypothetical protein
MRTTSALPSLRAKSMACGLAVIECPPKHRVRPALFNLSVDYQSRHFALRVDGSINLLGSSTRFRPAPPYPALSQCPLRQAFQSSSMR